VRGFIGSPVGAPPFVSRGGSLRIVKDEGLRRAFEEADSYAGLDKLAQQFERGVEEGTHAQKGWPNSMYGASPRCAAPMVNLNRTANCGHETLIDYNLNMGSESCKPSDNAHPGTLHSFPLVRLHASH
jgi:hypothetical protein